MNREDKVISVLFEYQAAKHMSKVAVSYKETQLTYGQLNALSNQVAHYLISLNMDFSRPIALYMSRSDKMVVLLLAILKAGGYYLILNPSDEMERSSVMMNTAECELVFKSSDVAEFFLPESPELSVWEVNDIFENAALFPEQNVVVKPSADDPAYLMFTSGSTGSAKGVKIPHRSICGYFYNVTYADFGDSNVFLQYSSLSWDVLTLELWTPLLTGASVVLYPYENFAINEFETLVSEKSVNILWITSSLFNVLSDLDSMVFSKIQQLLIGGEVLSPKHVHFVFDKYKELTIVNGYGPSECTVFSSCFPFDRQKVFDYYPSIPIGKPIGDRIIYLLNDKLKLVPKGLIGEICVGGDAVGIGYIGNQELDEHKFVANPFVANEKMFRTGDLGRLLEDGNIEYIGRIDDEVKIRGKRFNLTDIKKVTEQFYGIKSCAVKISGKYAEKKVLLFYVASHDIEESAVTIFLRERLPEYMIPAHLISIDSIPMNKNGKIDYNKLPDYEETAVGEDDSFFDLGIPEFLTTLWKQSLLNKPSIDAKANFFECGGNSLHAASLVYKVNEFYGIKISIADFFKDPTLAFLMKHIEKCDEVRTDAILLKKASDKEYYKLSYSQQRIFLIQNFDINSTVYNVPLVFKLTHASKNILLIEQTFRKLIHRHWALRTGFELKNGQAVQIVYKDVEINIEVIKVNSFDLQNSINKYITPFNLSAPPLFKIILFVDEKGEEYFMMDIHHIITDGWSQEVLIRDFKTLYENKELPDLDFQYKDFSEWQNDRIEKGALDNAKQYWMEELNGTTTGIDLPLDYLRPNVLTYQGQDVEFSVDDEELHCLLNLSKSLSVTPFIILKSVFVLFLSKISNQQQMVVGVPVSGRVHSEFNSIVGMFVNTLPVKIAINENDNFRQLVLAIHDKVAKCFEAQEYPIEKIIQDMVLPRQPGRNPLFDVLFVFNDFRNIPGHDLTNRKSVKSNIIENQSAKVDLSLKANIRDASIDLAFEYNTALFKRETINNLVRLFKTVFNQAVSDPLRENSKVKLADDIQIKRLLNDFCHQSYTPDFAYEKTLLDLWETQVIRYPDNIALTYANSKLTYAELSQRVNCAAAILLKKGVKKGDTVSLMIDKSVDMVVSMLAVMKSGAAYLPIDPGYPESRIAHILFDSNSKWLIRQESVEVPDSFRGILIDVNQLKYDEESVKIPAVESKDVAYLIYTSGSTGNPKGVVISHGAIVNTLKWRIRFYNYNSKDVTLQIPSYAFDSSVEDIFTILLSGGKLVIPETHKKFDLTYLNDLVIDHQVSNILVVPSFYKVILDSFPEIIKGMRFVTLAGENSAESLVKKHFNLCPQVQLYNEYGPTENAVCSTVFRFFEDDSAVSIGKPIDNVMAYVLDKNKNICPVGIEGELYLSGLGLASGYYGRKELTEEYFIPNPFIKDSTVYKTGDWCKWQPDGNLFFIGRKDDQIKIRGYRIELTEIEQVLLSIESISDAVIITSSKNDLTSLHAFYMSSEPVDEDKIYLLMRERLPYYMVPNTVQQIDRLPITPNGKTDKEKLKTFIIKKNVKSSISPPCSEVENILLEIWKELLVNDQISTEDHFFEIGGNSLILITLGQRIKKQLDVEVPVVKLFQYPTIKSMAVFLEDTNCIVKSDKEINDSFDILDSTINLINNSLDE